MQGKEDVKRGMHDSEYFNVSNAKQAGAGGFYDGEYFEVKSGQEEKMPSASNEEGPKEAESPAEPERGEEGEKGRVPKKTICRAQAEVLAGVLLCAVIAAAGAAGYGSLKQKQAYGSGETAKAQAAAKTASMLQLPNLLHAGAEEAQLQLAALGLKMQQEEEEHPDMAEGIVLFQEPAAGAPVAEADVVRVTISKGSELAAVPDLFNREKEAASALLAEAGLGCEVEEVFSDDIAAGFVVGQSTPKDEMLPKDSVVVISVSKGPQEQEQKEEEKDKGQEAASAQANKPAAPAAPKEQPTPQPAPQEAPQNDGGAAAPQPDGGGIQEENISGDWGGVGEEDLSGDW